jgi:hypothetical protein
MIRILGGIEFIRIVHRVSAVVLALVSIWHIGYAIWHWYVERKSPTMLPNLDDGKNALQALKYNVGMSKDAPQQGFYTFEEKMEYWALVWGTFVMVVTGFFLWNPITAARILPGEWIPAAKAAHGGEALPRQINEEKLKKRKRNFWAVYGIITTVWLVGIFWFVTSEQTAVAAIPPAQELESFVPLTPTPLPPGMSYEAAAARYGETWDGGVGELFNSRCGECHSAELSEQNLDLTTYQGALQGGDSGSSLIPGSPGISLVLLWPNFDDHPGKLSPLENAAIWNWIEKGAAEK